MTRRPKMGDRSLSALLGLGITDSIRILLPKMTNTNRSAYTNLAPAGSSPKWARLEATGTVTLKTLGGAWVSMPADLLTHRERALLGLGGGR
jgi:hypothetical protein